MDITHKLHIQAPAQAVRLAVSTEAGIKGWWSKDCKVGETIGSNSVLNFYKEGKIVTMGFRTLALDANKVVWECVENGNPAWLGTKLITEIEETADGCKVTFSHADFDEKWKGMEPFEMTKEGWGHFVKSLTTFCESGVGEPW